MSIAGNDKYTLGQVAISPNHPYIDKMSPNDEGQLYRLHDYVIYRYIGNFVTREVHIVITCTYWPRAKVYSSSLCHSQIDLLSSPIYTHGKWQQGWLLTCDGQVELTCIALRGAIRYILLVLSYYP